MSKATTLPLPACHASPAELAAAYSVCVAVAFACWLPDVLFFPALQLQVPQLQPVPAAVPSPAPQLPSEPAKLLVCSSAAASGEPDQGPDPWKQFQPATCHTRWRCRLLGEFQAINLPNPIKTQAPMLPVQAAAGLAETYRTT
jgi:hypothetical protein